jgi:hypothetical protein
MSNPHVYVTMLDGSEWDAQTLNPDLLRFESTAAKHKWPPPSVSPVTWLTFLAWSAGQREGHVPASMTWDVFRGECAQVSNPDKDDDVDPTQLALDID